MEMLWTWKGRFFGYRDDDRLWTYDGRHVGRFYDDDIYGPDGRYFGEILNGRLATKRSKVGRMRSGFVPKSKRTAITKSTDMTGLISAAGYDEFPVL